MHLFSDVPLQMKQNGKSSTLTVTLQYSGFHQYIVNRLCRLPVLTDHWESTDILFHILLKLLTYLIFLKKWSHYSLMP